MSGELLKLLIPLALCLGGTVLWLLAMAQHERRQMLRRIDHFRALQEVERSFGDIPHLCEEAKVRGDRKSPGEVGVKRTAPALVRTSHVRTHDTGVTNR